MKINFLVETETKTHYFSLVKIDEKLLADLEGRVNTEYQKDIAAIKRVLKLIRKNKLAPAPTAKIHGDKAQRISSSPASTPPALPASNGYAEKGAGIESRILSIVEKFPGQFNFSELLQAVTVSCPDQTIDRRVVSAVIFQNKGKRIRVVQEGRGRKRAIYEKITV